MPRHFLLRMKPHGGNRIALGLLSFVVLLLLWYVLTASHAIDPQFLPLPGETLSTLISEVTSGELIGATLISVFRVTSAFLIASLLGVTLGSLAGAYPNFAALVIPVNSALRYIPPTAFIGLTIIWFGIGEAAKMALIVLGIVFYILQMTADVVRRVPRVYREAAVLLGATRREVFSRVLLSASVPDILAVLRVNLGAAWTFLIVAEFVAAQSGLGYMMATSQRFLQTPRLFSLLILVGFLGFLSDALLSLAITHYSRWK